MKPQLVIRTNSQPHHLSHQQKSPLSQTTFASSPDAHTPPASTATRHQQSSSIFVRSNPAAHQKTSTNTAERARSTSLSDGTTNLPNAGSRQAVVGVGATGGGGGSLRPAIRAVLDDSQRAGSMDHRRPSESSLAGGAARRLAVGLGLGKLSSSAAGGGGLAPISTEHLAPAATSSSSSRDRYQSSLPPLPPPPSPEKSSPTGSFHQTNSFRRHPSSPQPHSSLRNTPSISSFTSTIATQSSALKSSLSPYDAKLISSSFNHLPPLPAPNSSSNPHPTPDPTSHAREQVHPHPSHPTSALSALVVHVLPLFNGDALRTPLEDLNALVRTHISATVSRSPSRAIALLTADLKDLVGNGMLTLGTKLQGIEDEKLIGRLVEVFSFFWTAIVPYGEQAFLL
jgi:hypothetical protein